MSREPAWSRVLRLMSLLPRRPAEFYDRMSALVTTRGERFWGVRGRYLATSFEHVLADLDRMLGPVVLEASRETALQAIEEQVRKRIEELTPGAPFQMMHNADFALARTAYLVCRALRPAVVVETGVAYGVTSAFILQALHRNAGGTLYSVDLPPLHPHGDQFVGSAIPQGLRSRWQLYRGSGQRVLPKLLPTLPRLDVFVHDSLHTFHNMQAELQLVTPRLNHRAVVLADDIQENRAYAQWIDQAHPSYSAVVGEVAKPALFGVAVMGVESAPGARTSVP